MSATEAEFWFADAAAAEAAGFKPAGGAAKQQVDDAPAAAFVGRSTARGRRSRTPTARLRPATTSKGNKDSMLFHVPGSRW